MIRSGLGQRIGHGGESFRLKHLDRSALREITDRLRPHARSILIALAATMLMTVATAVSPLLLRLAVDRYVAMADLRGVATVAVAYLALAGLAWWGAYWQRLMSERVGQRLTAVMRRDLFAHLLRHGPGFFGRQTVGELITRLTGDISAVSDVASSGILGLIADLGGVILTVSLMFWLDWRLALAAITMIPVVLGSTYLFGKRLRAAYAQVRERAADLGAKLQETLAGMRVVQALGQEGASQERFEQVNLYNLRANMYAMLVFGLFFPLMTITGNLGTAAILAYGGLLVTRGAVSLGTLIAFMAYIRNFFAPLRELSMVYNTLQSAGASLDRYHYLMTSVPDVQPPAEPRLPARIQGAVEFSEVSFGYGRGDLAVDKLTLRVDPGKKLALVGPSGAGKTTLVSLLTRMFDVTSGGISVDGVDLRDWPLSELRRAIAVVPQEAGLFPGSVLDNIRYGRPEATREEVVELARRLGVHEVFESLSQGYETAIGGGGAGRVSGGQRQVIAVLRAVMRDPAILILDEATSNVDGRTEALINAGLARALEGRTGIIIAHRLRGVGIADEIAVLDRGRLVDRGTHVELLERCVMYRDLSSSQAIGKSGLQTPD